MERYSGSGRQTHFCAVHSQKSAKLLEYIFLEFRLPRELGGAAALCGPVDFAGPALPTPSLHGTEYVRTRLAVVDTTRARLASPVLRACGLRRR